jgi:hypothetical protein
MANHVLKNEAAFTETRSAAAQSEAQLERSSKAFALSASVAIVFNTLLAWIKDAYDPLNKFMASLTGHHWTTHGIADVLLFVVLGYVLMNTNVPDRMSSKAVTLTVIASVIVSGLGLLIWFVLV